VGLKLLTRTLHTSHYQISWQHADSNASTSAGVPPPRPRSAAALQTKGVKSIVKIDPSDAAWYAAAGGGGAGLIGTLAMWPFMRRLLRQYDEARALPKDGSKDFKTQGIEEDR
jgi:hypothetical protein